MKYSTIFIDWNKTLSSSLFWENWSKEGHTHGHDFRLIQSYLFSSDTTTLQDWMRGKHTSEEVIYRVAQQNRLDYQLLFDEFVLSCNQMKLTSPEVPLLITELKSKGITIVIATDNMDSFSRWTVPTLRLNTLFDSVLNSSELQCLKSDTDNQDDPVFFKQYLQNYQLKSNECVLIDDDIRLEGKVKKINMDFIPISSKNNIETVLRKLLNEC